MKNKVVSIISFFVILVSGLVVFVLFSHMRPVFTGPLDYIGRIIIAIIFLMGGLFLKKSQNLKDYGFISCAYFIAIVATSIDLYFPSSKWLLSALNIPIETPIGIAIDKLDSTLIIVITILVLNKLSGGTLSSVFIQKGNWRKGLIIGLIAFVITAIGSYFMALLFGATNLTLTRILPWVPWILIFIVGNSFNEELLFQVYS